VCCRPSPTKVGGRLPMRLFILCRKWCSCFSDAFRTPWRCPGVVGRTDASGGIADWPPLRASRSKSPRRHRIRRAQYSRVMVALAPRLASRFATPRPSALWSRQSLIFSRSILHILDLSRTAWTGRKRRTCSSASSFSWRPRCNRNRAYAST
jgi:hypothetical protein